MWNEDIYIQIWIWHIDGQGRVPLQQKKNKKPFSVLLPSNFHARTFWGTFLGGVAEARISLQFLDNRRECCYNPSKPSSFWFCALFLAAETSSKNTAGEGGVVTYKDTFTPFWLTWISSLHPSIWGRCGGVEACCTRYARGYGPRGPGAGTWTAGGERPPVVSSAHVPFKGHSKRRLPLIFMPRSRVLHVMQQAHQYVSVGQRCASSGCTNGRMKLSKAEYHWMRFGIRCHHGLISRKPLSTWHTLWDKLLKGPTWYPFSD